MTYAAFLSAVLALLLAPGPTNTLVGLAGAQRGLKYVARLLPVELLGYLCTILPLVFIASAYLARFPLAADMLKVVAAVWVMFLAIRLWGGGEGANAQALVTPRQVYLTTMLNPKALVFGLVLLPAPADEQFLPKLGLFCLMVLGVALVWGSAGALSRRAPGGRDRMRLLQRIASAWLAVVSVTLIAGVLGA